MQSRSARLTRYLKSSFTALGHSQGCIQTGSSGTDLMAKLQHWRFIFNQRLNLCVRVKGVTAGTEYLGCYFPACEVFHCIRIFHPSSCIPVERGNGKGEMCWDSNCETLWRQTGCHGISWYCLMFIISIIYPPCWSISKTNPTMCFEVGIHGVKSQLLSQSLAGKIQICQLGIEGK